jgi:hypothetical protein
VPSQTDKGRLSKSLSKSKLNRVATDPDPDFDFDPPRPSALKHRTSQTMPRIALLAAPLLVALAAAPVPADDSRSEQVYFAPGGTGVVIVGSLEGRETVDYLLGAKAGQTLSVTMDSDNSAAYFNLIAPDEQDVAVHAGHLAAAPNRYEGTLDLDGDWKIRVYLFRAAADAGERAGYRLDIHITGEPEPSAAREPNDFGPSSWDARGDLGCARGGQPVQSARCPFKVVRYPMGEGATVFVVPPGTDPAPGAERVIYFQQGAWSTPTADPVSATRREDLWTLSVGAEVYEIPHAVIDGG